MAQRRDHGFATAVEMMYLLIFGLCALVLLGFAGRLHAAGVQVTNASQAAARAASQAANSRSAEVAAREAMAASDVDARCRNGGSAALTWHPSPSGTWQGGSVTVTVTCVVANASLSGIWSPGDRTVSASDTQPIDRYKR